ncbi:MAG: ArsR/SmtB family transcription factor [Acidimicrobiales bacterium]
MDGVAPDCCPSMLTTPLDAAAAVELARGFAALADPARLRVISLLAAADGGEVCVCDFVDPIGKSQPTVSHHLKVLGEAGLVVGNRRGKWVWYSLVPERLAVLQGALQA